jgi:hypothetical protein
MGEARSRASFGPKAALPGAKFSGDGYSQTLFGKGKGRAYLHIADLQREQNSTGGVQFKSLSSKTGVARKRCLKPQNTLSR